MEANIGSLLFKHILGQKISFGCHTAKLIDVKHGPPQINLPINQKAADARLPFDWF